jgi:hypothetical protein
MRELEGCLIQRVCEIFLFLFFNDRNAGMGINVRDNLAIENVLNFNLTCPLLPAQNVPQKPFP